MKYIVNDPVTNLFIDVTLPPMDMDGPNFTIYGYQGESDALFSLEYEAACCYYSITQSLLLANKFLNKKITNWAVTKNLMVNPRAGKQLNAYYDRTSLKFFYGLDPIEGKEVFASNSNDIISHEIGHAILDVIRPDLYNIQAMEVWAFHEAFADIHAMIKTLQYEIVMDRILADTGGDLRKSNSVSALAEEMGTAIFNATKGRMGNGMGGLRNLVNDFTYTEPEKLPKSSMNNGLSSEPHSFSRIFSGTVYDILVYMYERYAKTMPAKQALAKARDLISTYVYQAIIIVPNTIRFYDAMAKAMLVIDKTNNYEFNEDMNKCFLARNILKSYVKPMVPLEFSDVIEEKSIVLDKENAKTITTNKTEVLNLPEFMINVEIPNDVYYEFDNNGNVVHMVSLSGQEIVDNAYDCVDFLKKNDMIRSDNMAPFELDQEGNLKRTYFSCCCFTDNAKNPQEPEYGKAYKPENNTGCGCSTPISTTCIVPSVIPVRPCVSNLPIPITCSNGAVTLESQKIIISNLTRQQILLSY